MAATETDAAPVVQEDGKTSEIKEPSANSEGAEAEATDGPAADNREAASDAAAAPQEGEGPVASEDAAAPQENAAEPKTSLLDSFLNKSGLGKVMAGRKKKEQSGAAGGGGDETAAEGGEKEGEKGAEEGEEGDGKTAPQNGEEEENKAEKAKGAEPKTTVRDLIRKPVAKIFSHRSNEKKDGAPAECPKPVKVRSKSLDRLEDPEALNAMAEAAGEEGGASAEAEGDQKASATTKHMKRWHSFKKMMAQKTHKRGGGGGEEREEGESGARDSSTLDSKDSGQQKRWKLKRSWTFQGLKRDSSLMGISGRARGPDKDAADGAKEETAEGGEEAREEGGAKEAEGEDEKEKDEGGEEEKAAGGATVTQHANEIWTSFKKRVIPKSKRANTEGAPGGEEDAAAASGEEPAEDAKDGKSAKAKRSHFGRAVSLKNFIMRKGKSTSVDLGEGAKEEDEGAKEGGDGAEAGGAEAGGAEGEASATPPEETGAAAEEGQTEAAEAEKTPSKAAVTNGENGCSNGTAEAELAANHRQEESAGSPVKKVKEAGAKEDANAKIINATAAVNSGELELDASGSYHGDANHRHVLTNLGCKPACLQPELAYAVSRGGADEAGRAESCDQSAGEEEEEEQMKRRELRDAAVAIVQNVMSAAADQLEREMCSDNGLNGCYHGDM